MHILESVFRSNVISGRCFSSRCMGSCSACRDSVA